MDNAFVFVAKCVQALRGFDGHASCTMIENDAHSESGAGFLFV